MMQNLDTLKREIEVHLEAGDFVVFHGYSRASETLPVVHWDCEGYPDFKLFLGAARGIGARLVVYHHREFAAEQVDDALERLEAADIPRDEKRGLERRLKELRVYGGFTCMLELSFDHDGRTYVFDVSTEWYDELLDILDDIDATFPGEEEEDEGSIGGYYSRN